MLNYRMQTWNEAFRAFITKKFPERTQQEAAFWLRVSPSKIHYWCRQTRPVEETRKRIARMSKGEVSADLPGESGSLSDQAKAG